MLKNMKLEQKAALPVKSDQEFDLNSKVLENTGALIVVTDTDDRIVQFNHACESITGYTFEEIRGQKIWDLFLDKNDIAAAKEIFNALKKDRSPIKMDMYWREKSGRKNMIRWSNAALRNTAGSVAFIIAIGIDITTQHLNETAKDAWHEQFRILSEYAYDWEYWINPKGRFVHVSPSCERLTGYRPNDFYEDASLIISLVHPDDQLRVEKHFRALNLHVEHCQMEFRIINTYGKVLWISHHCRPVYDEKGNYLGQRASNRDISRQKDAEEALKKQEQELKKSARHLEEVNRALKLMLEHRHIETQAVATNASNNLKRQIAPYLEKLSACQVSSEARMLVNILQANIQDMINAGADTHFDKYRHLTPTEVHVADLIRQGLSSKEIAEALKVSPSTINIHRNKIRRKLGLLNTKTNLQSFMLA